MTLRHVQSQIQNRHLWLPHHVGFSCLVLWKLCLTLRHDFNVKYGTNAILPQSLALGDSACHCTIQLMRDSISLKRYMFTHRLSNINGNINCNFNTYTARISMFINRHVFHPAMLVILLHYVIPWKQYAFCEIQSVNFKNSNM